MTEEELMAAAVSNKEDGNAKFKAS